MSIPFSRGTKVVVDGYRKGSVEKVAELRTGSFYHVLLPDEVAAGWFSEDRVQANGQLELDDGPES